MIKRYNHAITFPVRILQVLKNHEMSISPIANGIVLLYDEFNIQSVFTVLIKEMIEILSMDAADTQTARFFGTFLMDMAHTAPKLLIPHLSKIGDELLNSESHVLRNSVFQVMGDVILSELTAEDLNDEFKEIRDEFLEDLLNHIMDVSAHCRSKVLQVWLNLKVNNAVPLSFQYKVLQETVDRLDDKTSVVRKNAIALFKAFLEHNPFSGKLSVEELNVKYEAENEKLQVIRKNMLEQERTLVESDEKWEDIAIDLLPVIVEAVKGEARQPREKDPEVEMVTMVAEMMAEKKFFEVVTLVMDTDKTMDHKDLEKMDSDEKCGFYMCLMKSYYMMARKIVDYVSETFALPIMDVFKIHISIPERRIHPTRKHRQLPTRLPRLCPAHFGRHSQATRAAHVQNQLGRVRGH
jgi:condensin complex subunit 1